MLDDVMDDDSQAQKREDYKLKILQNSLTLRNLIKESQADNVVLELCDERFQEEMNHIVQHPNYDRTFSTVHRILDENPEKLLKYDQIALDQGSFELLVAFDTCQYRSPCSAILGDRDFSITQKRFQAKLKLLEVYKEQAQFKSISALKKVSKSSIDDTIFGVANQEESGVSAQLKKALGDKANSEESKVGQQIQEKAQKEAARTQHDIYQEVFIDEINQQLLNSVQKADGEVVIMLMR